MFYVNLAQSSFQLYETQKAIEYFTMSLEIYGEKNPSMKCVLLLLAFVYKDLGENQKAIECYLKVLEIRKYLYGEKHLDVAQSYEDLANLSYEQGEYQKAIEYT